MVVTKTASATLSFLSAREDSDIKFPLAIVGLTGLAGGVPFLLYLQRLGTDLALDGTVYLVAGALLGTASLVAMNFLLWVFFTGSFYTIGTYAFGAEADFRTLLRLVGWSFVGLLGSHAIFAVRDVVLFLTGSLGQTAQAPGGQMVFLLVGAVSSLLVLGSVVLWIFSVYTTFYIGLVRSVITVVIPVAFAFGIFLVPYLL